MRTAGRTLTVLLLTLALAAGLLLPAGAREGEDGWRAALDAAVEYALDTRPRTGTGGGEWTALALARSGAAGTEDWLAGYWETLEETVAAAEGVLSQRKYTEYARAVLAVAALGAKLFREGKGMPAENFAPEYLRASQAERTRSEKTSSDMAAVQEEIREAEAGITVKSYGPRQE